MPSFLLAGFRSETGTLLRRGLAMKLIVVTSSVVVLGDMVWTNLRRASSDCLANGGRRMWIKETNGEVVYATKTRGTRAEAVAVFV